MQGRHKTLRQRSHRNRPFLPCSGSFEHTPAAWVRFGRWRITERRLRRGIFGLGNREGTRHQPCNSRRPVENWAHFSSDYQQNGDECRSNRYWVLLIVCSFSAESIVGTPDRNKEWEKFRPCRFRHTHRTGSGSLCLSKRHQIPRRATILHMSSRPRPCAAAGSQRLYNRDSLDRQPYAPGRSLRFSFRRSHFFLANSLDSHISILGTYSGAWK